MRGLLCEKHRKPETEEREEGGIVWTGRHVWEGGRTEDICERETMVVFLWQRTKLSVMYSMWLESETEEEWLHSISIEGEKAPEKPALQRQALAEALAAAESASVGQLTHTTTEVAAKVVE
jgi:hypothetical protein